jgi:hypothetical protein
VTSTLVFNPFFASVFLICLLVSLVLRILAHRCWRILCTSIISVRQIFIFCF